MNKEKIAAAVLSVLLLTGASAPAEAAKSVQVTLPAFDVTLNGTTIENENRRYPLLVYQDITYVPMTYHDCRFLGLETTWNQKDGLGIFKSELTGAYYEDPVAQKNSKRAMAQLASGNITVNGKQLHNAGEPYPLLLYRDVTYFPLTWRFAVDEFGWKYQFDEKRGLEIVSSNQRTESIVLSDGRTVKETGSVFDFTVDEEHLYYQGQNGQIYQRPLSDVMDDAKRKTVAQIPYENDYFEGYPAATLYEEHGSVYYRYHSGGAIFGGDYLYRLGENWEPERIINRTYDQYVDFGAFSIQIAGTIIGGRPAVPMTYLAADGTKSSLGPEQYYFGIQGDAYDKERNQLYVSAAPYDEAHDGPGISQLYTISLKDGSMTKLSERGSSKYAVAKDEVYIADSDLLYMHDLNTGEERLISNESLDRNLNYMPIESGVYYATMKDGQRFCFWDKKTGETTVRNKNGIVKALSSQNGYVIVQFEETPDNPHRMIVFDAQGKQVYTSADVVDKAVMNANGVLVYRLAGTMQLVKVQL